MKFKFQILDLLVVTACVASIASAFRADLILFRQLLGLFIVSLCSTAGLLAFRNSKRKFQFIGGVGGLMGGLIYLAIAFVFARHFYEPELFFSPQSVPKWSFDVIPALILSVLFGATIGPLITLRFTNCHIPREFAKAFWFSVVLISGIFLLGLFAMFDRQNLQSRDWLAVALVLSIVFVIHTNDWLTRFHSARVESVE